MTADSVQGFVRLVDVMGDESSIVQAARVSYGEGTKTPSDDITLIRYLMRHRHTTPFEMVEFKFHVRVPMDVWRQWIRHRTASVNEYSTRYSEAIDEFAKANAWRVQSSTNKQGSGGILESKVKELPPWNEDDPKGWMYDEEEGMVLFAHNMLCVEIDDIDPEMSMSEVLTVLENTHHEDARTIYKAYLEAGVAREQARKDLPLSTFTEAYWKIDLHNLLHFLGLRLDSHAQQEIREYAGLLAKCVQERLPNVWQAFCDYRLHAITLTALDLRAMSEGLGVFTNNRERDEFIAKGVPYKESK